MRWILDPRRYRVIERPEGNHEQVVLYNGRGTRHNLTDRALPLTGIFAKAATDKSINWVPRARWVVDGNIWSSSGITAGTCILRVLRIHLKQWCKYRDGYGRRLRGSPRWKRVRRIY